MNNLDTGTLRRAANAWYEQAQSADDITVSGQLVAAADALDANDDRIAELEALLREAPVLLNSVNLGYMGSGAIDAYRKRIDAALGEK